VETFVIAEIGINHGGSVEEAKRLINAAQESGASAVKFQTYTTEKRVAKDSPIFDLLKRCELSYGQQGMLKQYADGLGIEFFSTPFDTEAVDFLVDDLNCKRIKLSSFDVTNHVLLEYVNRKCYSSKNVILSTGMADDHQVYKAARLLIDVDLTPLHCKSSYPALEADVNLRAIQTLGRDNMGIRIGYSNHCRDPLVPALSVLAGADVVEAHFMVDEADDCVDKAVSLTASMFREMVENIKRFETIMGTGDVKLEECELGAVPYARPTSLPDDWWLKRIRR
jgi:N,N'-diacetyllegionaminate synthase